MSISRRDFLKTAAASGVAAGAMGAAASIAVADEEPKPPVLDTYDYFAESRVVWQDIPEDQIAETYDYDYVVIGGGAAGTTSALAGAVKGAGKVALLQNAYSCLSNGTAGGGIDLTRCDRPSLGRYKHKWNEMNRFAGDQHLIDNICNYSGEAAAFVYHWATEVGGVEPDEQLDQVVDLGDGLQVTNVLLNYGPKPRNFGAACEAMAAAGADNNLDVYYGMPGVKLIQDETGRVVAAIGKSLDDDQYYRFNAAKGVMLACGSYHCNPALTARYCSDAVGFDSKVPGYQGDGHLMGLLVGGVMHNGAYSKMVHDNDNPLQTVPFMAVNDNGERFMDEEVGATLVCNMLRDQPNPGWWTSIFDSNYQEQVEAMESLGSVHMTSKDGAVMRVISPEEMERYIPGTPENLELGIYAQECHTYKADTLEELAELVGIPADKMIASVERYNELVELGVDEDFGKQSKYLAPIVTPPFWGVHRHQRVSAILGGLNVDKYMRVVDANRQPIPGLYAAGNNAGNTCGSPDWQQASGGASIGNAMTGGYVAALHVSGLIGDEA